MSTDDSGRTIGQLVADASADVRGLVEAEIALAKAEITKGATGMGMGAGLLVGAAVFGLFGLFFLMHTLARVIAIWLPVWAGYLIVTLILFLVAGALGAVGALGLKKSDPKPQRALSEAVKTRQRLTSPKKVGPSAEVSAPVDPTPVDPAAGPK